MTTETSALDFKSATLYAIRVVLQHADTTDLLQALQKRMTEAGAFYENEPVVLDASRLEDPVDWQALVTALGNHRLPVIGVVAEGENLIAAQACGLVPVDLSSSPTRGAAEEKPATAVIEPVTHSIPQPSQQTATEAQPVPPVPTMVVHGPLRSGQRIYARNGDLIVMGLVSQGAEVIADGNIHIYGPLRGKAMAGAHGDASARIFTTGLDAELVAIAGVYRVIDSKLPAELHQQPALVQLEKDTLHIKPLSQ